MVVGVFYNFSHDHYLFGLAYICFTAATFIPNSWNVDVPTAFEASFYKLVTLYHILVQSYGWNQIRNRIRIWRVLDVASSAESLYRPHAQRFDRMLHLKGTYSNEKDEKNSSMAAAAALKAASRLLIFAMPQERRLTTTSTQPEMK